MKKNYLRQLCWPLAFVLFLCFKTNAQSSGDIAFISFNADGDDDFAIVALANISANSTFYITDNESDGTGGITSGEGTLTWLTGSKTIKAGTVITFTDVDNGKNQNFGVSIGTLSETGNFNMSPSSKDGVIIFTGTDSSTPTTFITALQIGDKSSTLGPFDGDDITLTATGLVIGTSIIVIDSSASPDGAVYNGSRSSQTSYDYYYTLLSDDANWTNIVNGNGETLLPFSSKAFTINTTTWTGNTSSVWNLSSNWDNGVPTSSSLVSIPDVTAPPIISSETEAQAGNITIESGETLTINESNSLTVNGELTISGSLIMNSSSSLIVHGTSTGHLTYNRTLASSNWYLVSSPVVGQDIDLFVTATSLQSGAASSSNKGLGTYNTQNDTWSFYQDGSSGTGNFISGQGHSINLEGVSGDISFTGTLLTNNLTPIALTTTGNGFNLIGNPYPSYMNSSSLLSTNTSSLLTETLWVWDQSANAGSGAYITKVTVDNFQIAPSQGFFIQSNGSEGNIVINENFQNHHSTNTFSKGGIRPEIHLALTDGTSILKSKIYYINGATTGFDNGFDGPLFGGVANNFSIYTHSVANDSDKKLAIQSLPDTDYQNMIIPIGINATSGTEISISANAFNLPTNINVYLEDKYNNSFTRLGQPNAKYTVALSDNLNGIGRFFLHTKSSVLSTSNIESDNINIYISSTNSLRIVGLQKRKAKLKMHNILGQRVLETSLQGNSINNITLSDIKRGLYIIELETQTGKLNKKILIE